MFFCRFSQVMIFRSEAKSDNVFVWAGDAKTILPREERFPLLCSITKGGKAGGRMSNSCTCLFLFGYWCPANTFSVPLQNIPAFFNSFPLLGSMCKCQFQSKKYQIFSFYIRMGWWNFLQFLCIETSVGHLTPHIHMHVYYSAVNESLLYVIYWEQEEHKFIQWRRICKASLPLSRWYVREASLFHHLQSKFSTHIYTTETRTKICYRQLDTIDAKILQKQQETLLVRQNIAFCSSDGAKITLGAFLDWLQDF